MGLRSNVMLALGVGLAEDGCGVAQPASRTHSNPASAFIVNWTVPVLRRLRKSPKGPSSRLSPCDLARRITCRSGVGRRLDAASDFDRTWREEENASSILMIAG